jgi:hypothetical protein
MRAHAHDSLTFAISGKVGLVALCKGGKGRKILDEHAATVRLVPAFPPCTVATRAMSQSLG